MKKARMMRILKTPPEFWRNDEQSVGIRYRCYHRAANRIENLEKEVTALKIQRCKDAEKAVQDIQDAYRLKTLTEKDKEAFKRLLTAAIQTLNNNLDLCDGNDCSLKDLREAVEKIVPVWELSRVL